MLDELEDLKFDLIYRKIDEKDFNYRYTDKLLKLIKETL